MSSKIIQVPPSGYIRLAKFAGKYLKFTEVKFTEIEEDKENDS